MKKNFVAGLLLAGVAFAGIAQAADDDRWYVAPMISGIDGSTKRNVDDGPAGAYVAFGKAISDGWTLELTGSGMTMDGFDPNDQWGLEIDFLRAMKLDGRFTPYALFGAGYLKTQRELGKDLDTGNLMTSFGIGVLTQLSQNSDVRLRSEVRYRSDLGSPTLNDVIFNIGVQAPIGAAAPPPPPPAPADSDGDGVPDDMDKCPGTPRGSRVDSMGCERDSDGDGVADGRDRCPGTPAGTKVDARGCELDSDGDGVANSKDKCPNTKAGVRVDVNGCVIKDVIKLPGVNFELNSARLTEGSIRVLDDAAATLKKHSDIKVEVAGHTDSTGDAGYNQSLSQRRAESVMRFLVTKGVDAGRLNAKGYGESKPIADNGTKDGRKMNRRVELRILD
ncbi:MAG: OmpA family protein [Gammaproteobacteria bacterium]|nr:OmpA family protein [Gammaproteobacteria bacterium]